MSNRDVSAIDHSIAATVSLEASSIVLSAPPAGVAQAILACSRVAPSRLEVRGGETTEFWQVSFVRPKTNNTQAPGLDTPRCVTLGGLYTADFFPLSRLAKIRFQMKEISTRSFAVHESRCFVL